jgi:hypothetical protein
VDTINKSEITYNDGSKYTGQLQDGKPGGQGVFSFADGWKYSGEFQNGFLSGEGTMIFADGTTYNQRWSYSN